MQEERRPIEHRAFGDHGEQRHEPDQVDGGVPRQREFLVFDSLRLVVRDEIANGKRNDGKGDHRDRDGMGKITVVLDRIAAERAAGEAAKAPEAVRGGHDRPGKPSFNHHGVRVHGDIHAADRAAEGEHGDGRQRHIGRERHDQQAEAAADAEPTRHIARAMPGNEMAAPCHGNDRADAEQEDQQAEREFGDVEPGQEHRDLRRPAAGQKTIGEENAGDGPAAARRGLHRGLQGHGSEIRHVKWFARQIRSIQSAVKDREAEVLGPRGEEWENRTMAILRAPLCPAGHLPTRGEIGAFGAPLIPAALVIGES
ncbi:hypothetical protein MPLA_170019 [Mesorhizobium sp. ORS 3359]|nr:hypothetical protein MPLA_170019 [Mesorhizobium sp. ORS 3359]